MFSASRCVLHVRIFIIPSPPINSIVEQNMIDQNRGNKKQQNHETLCRNMGNSRSTLYATSGGQWFVCATWNIILLDPLSCAGLFVTCANYRVFHLTRSTVYVKNKIIFIKRSKLTIVKVEAFHHFSLSEFLCDSSFFKFAKL